jgi:hypothetical protein
VLSATAPWPELYLTSGVKTSFSPDAVLEPGSNTLAIRTTGEWLIIMILLPVVYRLSAQLCGGYVESGIVCDAEEEIFSLNNGIKRPCDED